MTNCQILFTRLANYLIPGRVNDQLPLSVLEMRVEFKPQRRRIDPSFNFSARFAIVSSGGEREQKNCCANELYSRMDRTSSGLLSPCCSRPETVAFLATGAADLIAT